MFFGFLAREIYPLEHGLRETMFLPRVADSETDRGRRKYGLGKVLVYACIWQYAPPVLFSPSISRVPTSRRSRPRPRPEHGSN